VGELGVELGLELAQLWDGQLGKVDCAMLTKVCDNMWGRKKTTHFARLVSVAGAVSTPCEVELFARTQAWSRLRNVWRGCGGGGAGNLTTRNWMDVQVT
jgi:hypothetical protein